MEPDSPGPQRTPQEVKNLGSGCKESLWVSKPEVPFLDPRWDHQSVCGVGGRVLGAERRPRGTRAVWEEDTRQSKSRESQERVGEVARSRRTRGLAGPITEQGPKGDLSCV